MGAHTRIVQLLDSFSRALKIAIVGLILMEALSPGLVFATNYEATNRQIISTNTTYDPGWASAMVVNTTAPFAINSSAFDLQMNIVIHSWNNCQMDNDSSRCPTWLQAIVGIDSGSLLNLPQGYYVRDVLLEAWNNSTYYSPHNPLGDCDMFIPEPYINIDNKNYQVYVEVDGLSNGALLYIAITNTTSNKLLFASSVNCSHLNQFYAPFASQIEGVLVGCGKTSCGTTVSFSPYTKLFGGSIYFGSNYNALSSKVTATQTLEGSNLCQSVSFAGLVQIAPWFVYEVKAGQVPIGASNYVPSANPPYISCHPVIFTESNLPQNSNWCVTFNSQNQCVTGTSMTFGESDTNAHSYTVGAVGCGTGCQYSPSPSSGSKSGGPGNSVSVTYAKEYYLTMAMSGNKGCPSANCYTVPSSGWYAAFQPVTITAYSPDGECIPGIGHYSWTFDSWSGSGSGSYTGSSSQATVTMNGAITETAQYTKDPICWNGIIQGP